MALELAQVVAQLVQAVGALGEVEGREDSQMDLFGGPASDVSSAMQQDFEQADDAGVVDFDAGITHGADRDRQRDPLQQWKVDVNVEPLGLEPGKPADDALELVADLIQMVEVLFETKIVEVVGAEFVAQEHRELLVLPENSVAEVGAEHVMAVFDLIDDGEKLALVVTLNAGAEHLGYFVGGQSPQAKLTASLEQLVDGKVSLEDKIEAVLDLTDRIGA